MISGPECQHCQREDVGFSFKSLTRGVRDLGRRFDRNARREGRNLDKFNRKVFRTIAPALGGILMVVPGAQLAGIAILAAHQADRVRLQRKQQKAEERDFKEAEKEQKQFAAERWNSYFGSGTPTAAGSSSGVQASVLPGATSKGLLALLGVGAVFLVIGKEK